MLDNIREELILLAKKYETEDFLKSDPSQVMHTFDSPLLQEKAAFIAAALSYGNRKIFIPRIYYLLDLYLSKGQLLPNDDKCFYRLHTNRMVNKFLITLDEIYTIYGSIGQMMKKNDAHTGIDAVKLITSFFAERNATELIPKNTNSACKRICMFLRWMVRDNSPVDLGLWSNIIDKSTLIVPMDTHVLQEAQRLGLIKSKSGSMATALKLTEKLKEIFPDDPTRADFALFGLGVDENRN
jgi:uncharacterized protein (TIGR02757 family)